MSDTAVTTMSIEDFQRWDETQDDRHEPVDGVPVAMGGASQGNNQIVANVLAVLRNRLRGGAYPVATEDRAIRLPNGDVVRADAAVEAGACNPDACELSAPVLVVEVLSAFGRFMDHARRLEGYKAVSSIHWIVFVQYERRGVVVFHRVNQTWEPLTLDDPEAVLSFPDLELDLPMAEIYDRVFEEG